VVTCSHLHLLPDQAPPCVFLSIHAFRKIWPFDLQPLPFGLQTLPCNADAKKEAEAAKEREVALWQEALETGQKVHPLTEETLNKHMQGPIIIEDERNNGGNQQVGSCLAAWLFSLPGMCSSECCACPL